MTKVIKATKSYCLFGADIRLVSCAELVYKDNRNGTYRLLKYRYGQNNVDVSAEELIAILHKIANEVGND